MSNFIEGDYGSPYFPEMTGTAQQLLSMIDEAPIMPFAKKKADTYVVTRELPAQSLEGVIFQRGNAEQNHEDTPETTMLKAYQDAYYDTPVSNLDSVMNTGMVPLGKGVELEFKTKNGDFFTSVGSTVEKAMADGVAYILVKDQ